MTLKPVVYIRCYIYLTVQPVVYIVTIVFEGLAELKVVASLLGRSRATRPSSVCVWAIGWTLDEH